MRLLNVHTLRFEEFYHDDIQSIPRYIIASHRWSKHGEPQYKDVLKQRPHIRDSVGYHKVQSFCKIVRESSTGVDWLWIDTVCIDKSSSAELHESINCMFRWYANAECCLAYLDDVCPDDIGGHSSSSSSGSGSGSSDSSSFLSKPDDEKFPLATPLKRSKWFKRGWTLQELIAPAKVIFLDQNWKVIGHKGLIEIHDPHSFGSTHDTTSLVSKITKIPQKVLYDCSARKNYNDEEKFSWMANRRTTRIEDLAYCLLGIFEIFMPLVYGEGDQSRARLLKEILAKKEAEKAQMEEARRAQREAEVEWELASEERAIDVTQQVLRLLKRNLNRDEAVFQIAVRWHRKLGISVDQAVQEIQEYLRAIDEHAAWTRYQYKALRRQGLARATAVRRMEAELCRSGYNVIDAHRSVKRRLYFKPLPKDNTMPTRLNQKSSVDERGHSEAKMDESVQVPGAERLSSVQVPEAPAIKVHEVNIGSESTDGSASNGERIDLQNQGAPKEVDGMSRPRDIPADGSSERNLIITSPTTTTNRGASHQDDARLPSPHNNNTPSRKLWQPASLEEFVRVAGPLLVRKALRDIIYITEPTTVHSFSFEVKVQSSSTPKTTEFFVQNVRIPRSLPLRQHNPGGSNSRRTIWVLPAPEEMCEGEEEE